MTTTTHAARTMELADAYAVAVNNATQPNDEPLRAILTMGMARAALAAYLATLEDVRVAALEEAAKLCDEEWYLLRREECAEAIRELASQQAEG